MKNILLGLIVLSLYCIPNSQGQCINPWGYTTVKECNQHLVDVKKFCGEGKMPESQLGHIIILHHNIPIYSGFTPTVAICKSAITTSCISK